MARTISPTDYLIQLRTAAVVARRKGMHAEAIEAGRLADEVAATIKIQAR